MSKFYICASVFKKGPPVFESLLSDWTTKMGQTIKLTCKVTGSPKPVVSWLKGQYFIIIIVYKLAHCAVVSHLSPNLSSTLFFFYFYKTIDVMSTFQMGCL